MRVVNVTIWDSFSGIAEIKEKTDDSITLQWITAFPIYSGTCWSRDIYTKPSTFTTEDIYSYKKERDMLQQEAAKLRQKSMEYDEPIFAKYDELSKLSKREERIKQAESLCDGMEEPTASDELVFH